MASSLLFKECMKSHELVEIYDDAEDPGKYCAGYVSALNEEQVLISHIHPCGQYDGYAVKLISDIYRINRKTKYCGTLETLYRLKKGEHPHIRQYGRNQFYNVLMHSLENKLAVTLEILDDDRYQMTGMVRTLGKESLILSAYNEHGEFDGEYHLRIGDMTHLLCDGEYESAISLLLENGKQE